MKLRLFSALLLAGLLTAAAAFARQPVDELHQAGHGFAAAQVRELQLRQRLQLQARNPQGRELMPTVELLLTRDLSYSETAALGKQQEEEQLYREMQDDVVQQVLRRLAAIRL